MNAKRRIKKAIRLNNTPKLKNEEVREVKVYYKANGYKLNNTYWHAYYKAINGEFHKDYIPLDIFNSEISPKLNSRLQWPALLDKNILNKIFDGFKQPKCVAQNINGFYYMDDKLVNLSDVIDKLSAYDKPLIIKPTIETGRGKLVNMFTVNAGRVSCQDSSLKDFLKIYKKNFIIQEFLEQSNTFNALNSSSLNTLRVMSYLNETGVHVLSTLIRIGKKGSVTDNYAAGGIICGINTDGSFKKVGYNKNGKAINKTETGIMLSDCLVPNYGLVKTMVKAMHIKVPYFKIVSWDIAIDKDDQPVFVEYNTYNQSIDIQIVNGPLFGEFTEEILAKAL